MDQTEEEKCLRDEISLLSEGAKIAVKELKELHAEQVKAVEEYFKMLSDTSKVMTDALFSEKRFNCFRHYEKAVPWHFEKESKRSVVRILKFSDEIDNCTKRFRDFQKSLWVIYEKKKAEHKNNEGKVCGKT